MNTSPLTLVVKRKVAMAEGAAHRVLAGQADRMTLCDQRRERERFGGAPVDRALEHRRLAPLHLPHQLGVRREVLGEGEQLVVERGELASRDSGAQHRVVGLFDHLLVGEIVELGGEVFLHPLVRVGDAPYIALACASASSGLISPSATSCAANSSRTVGC